MKPIRPLCLPLLAGLALAAGCEQEPLPETPPRQLSASEFQYPEELWDAGVEGETVLRLFVTAGGTVDSVLVERTSRHSAFDQAAAEGARQLRFEPARRGEEPVGAWVLLPVQFRMAEEGAAPAETAAP
ncbi:MAG TPA: energy transducer TonB [Longimicrobiaceae bacterium]|nr:energy transducer TonB [Longimicrobiaceae bacterium]